MTNSASADPILLTPGPLTTSATVKQAMTRDWGSRDGAFIAMNRTIRDKLAELAHAADSHVTVPLQGSGTFAVEAMIGTMVPADGKLLVLINGAYGQRILRIARTIGLEVEAITVAEDEPVCPETLDAALTADDGFTHVAVVHCETTSGILNPLAEVAAVTQKHGRALLVDSMSAFGALPVDARTTTFQALAASSNKCLEGAPGMGFVLVERRALAAAEGNAHSLSLDLNDQWKGFEANGQWRFTPPTHVLAAFHQALLEHADEGGVEGRGARYRDNRDTLIAGMRALGFETLLPDVLQAPIIITFHMPADPKFVFADFYDRLRDRGFVIYPGKLTVADSFRMGCIGRIDRGDIERALAAVRAVLGEMGVTSGAPAL